MRASAAMLRYQHRRSPPCRFPCACFRTAIATLRATIRPAPRQRRPSKRRRFWANDAYYVELQAYSDDLQARLSEHGRTRKAWLLCPATAALSLGQAAQIRVRVALAASRLRLFEDL